MPGGWKPKRGQPNHNISGLQNQPKPSPAPSEHSKHTTPAQSQAPSPDYDDEDDESDLEEDSADLDLLVHWDSQKTQYVNDPEDKGEGEVVDGDDDEELQEWKGFGKEELLVKWHNWATQMTDTHAQRLGDITVHHQAIHFDVCEKFIWMELRLWVELN